MKIKECGTEQLMVQQRNQRRNLKTPGDKIKMEIQQSKICGIQQKQFLEGSLNITYFNKQEKSQINNLALHLKELGKKE